MAEKKLSAETQEAKAYLEDAGATLKVNPASGAAHRLAVARALMDKAGITDAAERKRIWKEFAALPGWFGCNASAARQACGFASIAAEVFGEDVEV